MKLALLALPLIASANLSLNTATNSSIELSPSEVENIKAITLATIKQSPQLIAQQISNYQQQKIVKTQSLDLELIQRYQQEILGDNTTNYGNIKADNIIVEFVDYNCSHCKQMLNTVKSLASSTKNIKVIVKDLPVLGISSENAAKAAIAASKQGKYLQYQEYLIATTLPYSEENLVSFANRLKLDPKQFLKDYKSPETKAQITANRSLARKLMITATPSIVVTNKNVTIGKIIPGALNTEQLKSVLHSQ